jgi:predicted house-cleaning noncanonical NTP pyrophosphatase (MazG superfamily)
MLRGDESCEWERNGMTILREEESREELKRRILEEAEEFHRRNPPDPDQGALLGRILRRRSEMQRNPSTPDCVELLREDRGGWPEDGTLEDDEVTDRRDAVAILRKEETREEWRRRIFAEAEEFRRRHPVPDQEEVLAEARRLRESVPKDLKLTDSAELLREDRER